MDFSENHDQRMLKQIKLELLNNLPILIGGKLLSYDEKNYSNGILRIGVKDNFQYIYTSNNVPVTNEIELERIKKLKIPPIWTYVWISIDPNSEIQVIGHDTSGKKQYLYTQKHKDEATKSKFKNLKKFISKLPKLANVLKKHKELPLFDKNRVLAIITEIILLTGIRAGKEFHAKKSGSYGITSLRKNHIKLDNNDKITLSFSGKGGIQHKHIIYDKGIHDYLEQLLKLRISNKDKDDKLFLYHENPLSTIPTIKKITEHDLNNYLHENVDKDIVIKDIRTFVVNFLLIKKLLNDSTNKELTLKKKRKILLNAIKQTAEFIQHTPNISKKSYIHPKILEEFVNNYDYFYTSNKNEKSKGSDPVNILIDLLK